MPPTTEVVQVPQRTRLDHLAEQIIHEVQACQGAFTKGVGHALAAGRLLLEARDQVDHGEWLPYIERCGLTPRTAQRYMRVADRWKELESKCDSVSHLTMEQALDLIAEPKEIVRLTVPKRSAGASRNLPGDFLKLVQRFPGKTFTEQLSNAFFYQPPEWYAANPWATKPDPPIPGPSVPIRVRPLAQRVQCSLPEDQHLDERVVTDSIAMVTVEPTDLDENIEDDGDINLMSEEQVARWVNTHLRCGRCGCKHGKDSPCRGEHPLHAVERMLPHLRALEKTFAEIGDFLSECEKQGFGNPMASESWHTLIVMQFLACWNSMVKAAAPLISALKEEAAS